MDLITVILIVCLLLFLEKRQSVKESFENEIYNYEQVESYTSRIKDIPIKKDYIFVSVASYRDEKCLDTVKSLFTKAQHPDRIIIGICQQNSETDPDCRVYQERLDQIKIVRLTSKQAQGPTYARYICSKLWDGEEYFMQIDAHTLFEQNWDTTTINMLKKCPSDKPLLTHYPLSQEQITNKEPGVPFMCDSKFDGNKMINLFAGLIGPPKDNIPVHCPYVAAGFLFTYGSILYDVPYDPYTPFLFQGEEYLHSARMWTHGWDFFQPTENICSHYYGNEAKDKNNFWTEHLTWNKTEADSLKRAKFILGFTDKIDAPEFYTRELYGYGLGNTRTMEDYLKFSGIDSKKEKGEYLCTKIYDKDNGEWK